MSALAALRDVQSWQWGQVHGAFSSSLGVRHWIHTPPSAMTMHFNAIPGAPFTILAVATPRNVVEAGIGLHAHLRKNLSAVLSYQGDYGRGLVSNEVQVHLNLNF